MRGVTLQGIEGGIWSQGRTCHAEGSPQTAPPLGFTLVVDQAAPAAAAASGYVGAEGVAGSDDWEDLERNLGWVGGSSQRPHPSIPLASGNLSWTSRDPTCLCGSPASAT